MRRRAEPRRAPRRPERPRRPPPKALDAEPTLFVPAPPGGAGTAFLATSNRRRQPPLPPGAHGEAKNPATEEVGLRRASLSLGQVPDPETLRRAREIAERLSIPRPRRHDAEHRGSTNLRSQRYQGGSDDIDLDATLAVLAEHPVPDEHDIVVREWTRSRRAVVLAVDISGSMRGDRIRTAAATVGAVVRELVHDDLAVVAFWSDAVRVVDFGSTIAPGRLVELLARVPAQGLTNVAFPLDIARAELARLARIDGRVLLLSDCVHNAGPDPRQFAARLPRLDVLVDVAGEHDLALARDLARFGRGRMLPLRTYKDAPAAVSMAFGARRA